jgi:uncharacterized protein YodC (DUF2158 family)
MNPKQGDLVKIKSGGGPTMTVGCRLGDAHWCTWWDEENKRFKDELLYLSQLEVVERK